MNRRQWLIRIIKGFSLTGLAALSYPLFRYLGSEQRVPSGLVVPIADLKPGETKNVLWQGRRVLIIRRTERALTLLGQKTKDQLKDSASLLSRQPPAAGNRFRSVKPEFFVTYLNCSHLGCEVSLAKEPENGFLCPCHQSAYDASGRVLVGSAAPLNLEIPVYYYINDEAIVLVERG